MQPDTARPRRDARSLRCMEIWGGNSLVEEAVATPGLDAWVYSRPHEGAERGGDVHYVSLCGGGLITRLIVADVSGHGAVVADFATALRALMRKNINRKSQARLVAELNRQFGAHAQSRRFATAVVATYLASTRRLAVCNAGHPVPLWFRADRGAWALLDHAVAERDPAAANLPLGIDEAGAYDQFAVGLGRGDLVVFYTDALTEAADDAGRLLGQTGLLDLARGLDRSDPSCLGKDLLAAVDRHRCGRPCDDDVTVLVLHHNAAGPRRLSLGEKLDVYAKVFHLKPV
jgi:sigma-B regulation protein RsbU (phosphoserine phosphatase)